MPDIHAYIGMTKCLCGHPRCDYHGTNNGSFPNGAGYDYETARRMVACWNACVGIETDKLTDGLVSDLENHVLEMNERDHD